MRTAVLLLLFVAFPLLAQEEFAIPAVRPSEDFYEAVGQGIKVQFRVEKREVTALDWFALTLVVEKIENPEQMLIPDLRQRDEFHERFDFKDWPPNKHLDDNRCEITYHVRAKDDNVTQVPAFRFRYYRPGSDTGNLNVDFPTTLSPSIPLKVRPAAIPLSPVQPLEPDALLLKIDDHLDLLAKGSPHRRSEWRELIWLIPPGLGIVWVWIWFRRYPDAAKLARLRQSRAARRALAQLQRSVSTETSVVIFLDYLRERFGLESWRTTPIEVREGLKWAIEDNAIRFEISDELREADRSRFAPVADPDDRATRFHRLILVIEETTP